MIRSVLLPALAVLLLASGLLAENWPGWRGPRGDGSSTHQAPVHWDGSEGENIQWTTKIPGQGHSSPVVWNGRVFLTSCDTETTERMLICLDRHSGKIIWKKAVFQGPLDSIHALNSHASATPATDGKLVFVTFQEVAGAKIPAPNVGNQRLITPGRMLVAAYDFQGNQKWLARPGGFISAHGFSNCPVIHQDLVIINGDHDGDSYVVALEKKTGSQRWKVGRRHKIRSYVTPLIRQIGSRTQMVFSGSQHIVSLDPADGSEHWMIEGPTEQFVASMVFGHGLFFMTCGFPDYYVMGIRPDGDGDVTGTHVAWESTSARSYVPSPAVLGGYLLIADDRGTANCFDAHSGKRLWNARLGKGFSASLVHAGGLAYFVANDGITKVVRPGPKLDVVAQNPLGEYVSASPAISDGQLFIRGEESLFCIGPRNEAGP